MLETGFGTATSSQIEDSEQRQVPWLKVIILARRYGGRYFAVVVVHRLQLRTKEVGFW